MKFPPLALCGLLGLTVLGTGAVLRTQRAHPGMTGLIHVASLDNANRYWTPPETKDAKLTPGPDDANVAALTTQLLQREHYLHAALNDSRASRFLNEYFDSLDPAHLYFLQSDIDEFASLRPQLAQLTQDQGDTSPADKIFARFLKRYDEQTAYVLQLLKTEKFTFDGNDSFVFNRKDLPRPKSPDEAKQLWRQYLRYQYLQEKLNKETPEQIVDKLSKRYTRQARSWHDLDDSDVFEIYLNALAHVYDPHTDYFGAASADQFNIQMRLSLGGIGAQLTTEDGYCKIAELIAGGPAIKSNALKVGDKIVAVGQATGAPVDVVDMKLNKIVDMIRGPKGTKVRLTIIPADAPDPSTRKTVVLIRDEVKLEDQAAKARIIDMPGEGGKTTRLGVIDLPSFYGDAETQKSTTGDVQKLLQKFKEVRVDGVILDLRRNGGGLLTEAISLTGLFIKEGPVVQVKNSDGSIRVDSDEDPSIAWGGPLIVLTSRGSASASEILAGALQDYGRALIVGDSSTFGKGTVQAMIQLKPILDREGVKTKADPGSLKLTIQKFYRASGSSTQLKGVVPDIVLPSLYDATDIGEKSLDNPMPWDTIPSANYEKLNLTQPYVPMLKQRSDARTATDPDFVYLRNEIEVVRKTVAAKSVSLNEAQRRKEKEEADARVAERKKALQARPMSGDKVYLLSLEQAAKPGLPPVASAKDLAPKAKPALPDPENASNTPEDTTPPVDITLDEARRILADYVALMQHKSLPSTPVATPRVEKSGVAAVGSGAHRP